MAKSQMGNFKTKRLAGGSPLVYGGTPTSARLRDPWVRPEYQITGRMTTPKKAFLRIWLVLSEKRQVDQLTHLPHTNINIRS